MFGVSVDIVDFDERKIVSHKTMVNFKGFINKYFFLDLIYLL